MNDSAFVSVVQGLANFYEQIYPFHKSEPLFVGKLQQW